MKTGVKTSIAFMSFIFLFACCKPEEKFDIVPNISFVSLTKIPSGSRVDDQGTLTIHFQDGDGDIGLDASDLIPPFDTSSVYYYNFFIDYYEKQNGTFVKVDIPGSHNARIPRLSNSVPESIEGDISIDIPINNITSPYDTIRFECYITDRQLHHSNRITTSEIIVNKGNKRFGNTGEVNEVTVKEDVKPLHSGASVKYIRRK